MTDRYDFKARACALVAQMTPEECIAQMSYNAPAIPRLGVPAYHWWNEGLHGVGRAGVATVFPQAIGMAASFNDALLRRVGDAIADEARANYNEYQKLGDTDIYHGLTYWSPNINIFRDPRWGRGQETYGEDPYLTGRMGTAFVQGLQGNGVYRKLDATIKHYAVHSGPEAERHQFDAVVGEKDLNETYLWAFHYCLTHAHPSAVMGAYNRVNGEPCCASPTLLQQILRDQFGFDGYVVSDCGAVRDIYSGHHVADSAPQAAALAVRSGCDLNYDTTTPWLTEALHSGLIDKSTIVHAAERLFEARFRLGMFDADCEYNRIPYETVCCPAHTELNREMAQESIVLLKNNGLLPLNPAQTIVVIGPNADDRDVLLGNYNGLPRSYTTFLRGIQEAANQVLYAKGCCMTPGNDTDEHNARTAEALIAAQHADVVVMVMGIHPRLEGEEGDALTALSGDKADLELPAPQRALIRAIAQTGKPVVFVNVSGSCINLKYENEHFDAVLQCFYPGAEGGYALADILFGKVSPSGRLPITFYESCDDLPPFEDYDMHGRTYRYYAGTPVYPFGHGLSYADVSENWLDENTVQVTNHGGCDTKYTVLQFKHRPEKTLTGFRKIFVSVGETVTVRFEEDFE